MVTPEHETILQAPDRWGTCQGNNTNKPWLLHLPKPRKAVVSLSCLLGLKLNISKSTGKVDTSSRGAKKDKSQYWEHWNHSKHSQKDPSDEAGRMIITHFSHKVMEWILAVGSCCREEPILTPWICFVCLFVCLFFPHCLLCSYIMTCLGILLLCLKRLAFSFPSYLS